LNIVGHLQATQIAIYDFLWPEDDHIG